MQGARRKISKRELKEDQLVTFYYKSRSFLEKHGKIVGWVIAGLIAVVVIITLMIRSRIQANVVAGSELFQAQMLYNSRLYNETAEKLIALIETYPGTKNSAEACILLAKTYYQLADYDSSQYYAAEFIKKRTGSQILVSAAYAIQAASLEEKGEFEAAAQVLIEGADRFPHSFTAPMFLLDAGRCYCLSGQMELARESNERILRNYPQSELVFRANEQLARAGGRPHKIQKTTPFF